MSRKDHVPPAPPFLQGEALEEWKRVAPGLHRRGLLGDLDRGALATYCAAWARLSDAERRLTEHGLVILSPAGFPVQSPYVGIAHKAGEDLRAAAGHFGMTPASRAAVAWQDATASSDWRA